MRSASADEVQAVAPPLVRSSANVDGWVFPDTIYNIFTAGDQHEVPVLIKFKDRRGGAFLLHAAGSKVEAYDGRETAPAAATPPA